MPATKAEVKLDAPLFPRPITRRPFVIGALAMLLAIVMAPFTNHTYYHIVEVVRILPDDLIIAGREFPNLYNILAFGALIYIYMPRKRKYLIWFVVAIAVCSILNEIPKRTVGRARPRYSLMMDEDRRERIDTFIKEHPETKIVPEKRDQWLFFSPRPLLYDGYASFPSGHTNSAFCLAAFMCIMFYRGRWVFLIMAFACGISRVYQYRHFPEDVLFGGGLAWFAAHWVFTWGWPGRVALWLDAKYPWMKLHTEGLIPGPASPQVAEHAPHTSLTDLK